MSIYLKIRKWVDRDLSQYGKPLSLIMPQAAAGLAIMAMPTTALRWMALLLIGVPCFLWTTFVLWRGWRLTKAHQLRSARYYEQYTRYTLPTEYADSEDALLAKRRKAKQGVSAMEGPRGS